MDNLSADIMIEQIASGSMSALEKLYTDMYESVYMLALSITRNRELAQDVMQDTFVRVHSYAHGFKKQGYGRAWVMRIARNLALTAVSKATRSDEFIELESQSDTQEEVISKALLDFAMSRLNLRDREIIMMHASQGLTMAEIADVLECPVGTVKWRHAQALKKLRKFMIDEEAAL